MVAILMVSAKLAFLGLLKIKAFWSKGYDVKIYVHDLNKKIISRDSIIMYMWSGEQSFFLTLAFLWEKLS